MDNELTLSVTKQYNLCLITLIYPTKGLSFRGAKSHSFNKGC